MELKVLIERRIERIETLTNQVIEDVTVACGKGCAYCCYGVPLLVPMIEIVQIVDFLNQLPPKEKRTIATRLSDFRRVFIKEAESLKVDLKAGFRDEDVEKIAFISSFRIYDLPCPFLREEDLSCRIYRVRPVMCRLTVSEDKELCRKDWEDPLSFVWAREIKPLIDRVKDRFFKAWFKEAVKLYPSLGDFVSMEKELHFLPELVRFDPLRRKFKIK